MKCTPTINLAGGFPPYDRESSAPESPRPNPPSFVSPGAQTVGKRQAAHVFYAERGLARPGSHPIPDDVMNKSSGVIRVLVADDHPLVREGIRSLLADAQDIQLVAEARDGREAVDAFRTHRPDVLLLDIQMPHMNGIEVIEAIQGDVSSTKVIVLTTFQGDAMAQRALKAGAHSYLLKTEVRKNLAESIRTAHFGKRHIDVGIALEMAKHMNEEALTERELSVLQLVAAGNSNKRIGTKLGITEGTVKNHIKNILNKLGANDRTHAATIAVDRGFITASQAQLLDQKYSA